MTVGKPSQVLTRLCNLNDGTCNDDVIRAIFMEQLPAQARAILAMSKVTDLHEFAEKADKVVEASGIQANPVFSISSQDSSRRDAAASGSATPVISSSTHWGPSNRELESMINALTKQVADLANVVRRSSRDARRRSRSLGRSTSRPKSREPDPTICWMHRKFGNDSRKCQKPCPWSSGN